MSDEDKITQLVKRYWSAGLSPANAATSIYRITGTALTFADIRQRFVKLSQSATAGVSASPIISRIPAEYYAMKSRYST